MSSARSAATTAPPSELNSLNKTDWALSLSQSTASSECHGTFVVPLSSLDFASLVGNASGSCCNSADLEQVVVMSHGLGDVQSFLNLLLFQDTAVIAATAVPRPQIDMLPRCTDLFPLSHTTLHRYMWPAYA